jgi:FAD/FMN-containing dehydrogenase
MDEPINLFDFDEVALEARDNFLIARGFAIQAYASLEQSLCTLFNELGEMPPAVAGIIFFKITSARSRLAIIEKLKRRKMGAEYAVFFNAMTKAIGQLDERRNQVVHWDGVPWHEPDRQRAGYLMPPNRTAKLHPDGWIDNDGLVEFDYECDFYAQAIIMFLSHRLGGPLSSSPDIFQRPLEYPPPDTHPLFRKRPERQNPPQSSQV